MKSTNDNLRNAKRRDDAVNPNLDKMQKYSRNMSVIPMTAMLQNTPDWKIKQALTKIKSPIDYMSGQVDITKSYRDIFNPHGQRDTVVAPVAQLLLDLFPNAAAAYSLRKVRTDYDGAAIRVRRSTDNAELDIGFVDNDLDTASLLTFAGAGNGFVTTWYDQSLNGNDATQPISGRQSSIVLSGVLNTFSGKPTTIGNTDTNYYTSYSTFTGADGTYSTFIAAKLGSSFEGVATLRSISNEIFRFFNHSTTAFRLQQWNNSGGTSVLLTPSITANSNAITSFIRSADGMIVGINGLTNSVSGLGLGRKNVSERLTISGFDGGFGFGFESPFSEAIFYPSDQTANRAAIEENINDYYSVY